MSTSTDNFLKAIYQLKNEGNEIVSGRTIAVHLKVSSAAITEMAKKLSEKGLVKYSPYKKIELTSGGEKEAVKIIRKHRLWEMFLFQVLEMNLKDVHNEAEKLEHHTSETLINKIEEHLNYPPFDPHGEPIPGKDGKIKLKTGLKNLTEIPFDTEHEICRIKIRHNEIFDLFEHYDIRPGVILSKNRHFEFDESLEISIKGKDVILSKELAEKIDCIRK